MNLTLTRALSSAQGTLGTLVAGDLKLRTIELPWDDNVPDKSCVPAGQYLLVPYISPKHGRVWRLHNPELNVYGQGFVPEGGRNEIEIHAANFARELLGCIAVGLTAFPMLDGVTHQVVAAVNDSDMALNDLRNLLDPGEEDFLTIIWADSASFAVAA